MSEQTLQTVCSENRVVKTGIVNYFGIGKRGGVGRNGKNYRQKGIT